MIRVIKSPCCPGRVRIEIKPRGSPIKNVRLANKLSTGCHCIDKAEARMIAKRLAKVCRSWRKWPLQRKK